MRSARVARGRYAGSRANRSSVHAVSAAAVAGRCASASVAARVTGAGAVASGGTAGSVAGGGVVTA
jgi:hypothetical protein